jgi:hypothetical protein
MVLGTTGAGTSAAGGVVVVLLLSSEPQAEIANAASAAQAAAGKAASQPARGSLNIRNFLVVVGARAAGPWALLPRAGQI